MLPRGCPAATRPSTIAFTTSWCVVKSSPPAARNFDSDLVRRRNQRRPRLRHIRLAGRSEDEPIDHRAHDRRIRLVVLDRVGIVHRIHDRRRGCWLRALDADRGSVMAQKRTRATFRIDNDTLSGGNGLYEQQARITTGRRRGSRAGCLRHRSDAPAVQNDSPSLRSHSVLRAHLPILRVLQGLARSFANSAIL